MTCRRSDEAKLLGPVLDDQRLLQGDVVSIR